MPTDMEFGKRKWVKLWTNELLDGTTRYQMSGAQRALWIDLLALASRSRYPGIICAGRDGDQWVGYPISKFQGLDACQELDIAATLELFQRTGKISMTVTHEIPVKLVLIEILNWRRYQSNLDADADRSRRYRQRHSDRHGCVTPRVTAASRGVTQVEVEGDGEVDKTIRASDDAHGGDSSQNLISSANDPDDLPFATPLDPLPSEMDGKAKTVHSAAAWSQQEAWWLEFYSDYWLKRGKKEGRRAFAKAVKTEAMFQKVMAAMRAQKPEMLERKRLGRTPIYAATWLNGERWNDELSPVDASSEPPRCVL